jgi:hypothetical protein
MVDRLKRERGRKRERREKECRGTLELKWVESEEREGGKSLCLISSYQRQTTKRGGGGGGESGSGGGEGYQ